MCHARRLEATLAGFRRPSWPRESDRCASEGHAQDDGARRGRALAAGCGGSHAAAPTTLRSSTHTTAARPGCRIGRPIRRLVPVDAGTLDLPVQDAARHRSAREPSCSAGSPQPTPRATTSSPCPAQARGCVGHLPGVVHDAAAVTIGKLSYVFGGGNGPGPDRHDRAGRSAHGRGRGDRPPAGAELRPDRRGDRRHRVHRRRLHGHALARHDRRVEAGWPRARRRASSLGGSLCGGDGGRREVWSSRAARCRPARRPTPCTSTRRRRDVSSGSAACPQPTTHAAAATFGSTAYVIGGRGAVARHADRPHRRHRRRDAEGRRRGRARRGRSPT